MRNTSSGLLWVFCLAGLLGFQTPVLAASTHQLVAKGNALFSAEKYNEALEAYKEAEVNAPESPHLYFNKGAALYKKGDYAAATEAFQQAALKSKDMALESRSKFNLGLCAVREAERQQDSDLNKALEAYGKSIQYFRETLELDPDFQEAAENIELVRLLMKSILDEIKKREEEAKKQQEQMQKAAEQLKELIERQQDLIARNSTLSQEVRQNGQSESSEMQNLANEQDALQHDTQQLAETLANQNQNAQGAEPEAVTLPPLSNQPALTKDFKIPQERAVGESQGKTKIFTQTIRALRPDIREIPPIELPYFNTKTGKYEIAQTAPIPIIVNATNVVTALDAEGHEMPVSTGGDVETWTQGIAYNYEDLSVLKNQRTGLVYWLKSPVWLGIIIMPLGVYLVLLCSVVIIRKRHADPSAMRAKKAYGTLLADLKIAGRNASGQESTDLILRVLRNYLGDKLRMPPGALVFNDVRDLLAEKGVTEDTLENLKNIFEQCEASRYAGASHHTDIAPLSEQVSRITKQLEKILK